MPSPVTRLLELMEQTLAGLGAGLLSDAAIDLHCPAVDPSQTVTWDLGAVGLLTAMGALLGRVLPKCWPCRNPATRSKSNMSGGRSSYGQECGTCFGCGRGWGWRKKPSGCLSKREILLIKWRILADLEKADLCPYPGSPWPHLHISAIKTKCYLSLPTCPTPLAHILIMYLEQCL